MPAEQWVPRIPTCPRKTDMVTHFRIRPPRDFDPVLSASIQKASADPCILHFDKGDAGHLFLFCHTPDLVEPVRKIYEREKRVSAGVCYLIFVHGEIRVDLE